MAGGDPAPAALRRRIGLGAHVWWDAVSSGAFLSPAALWISILISVTVMAPFQHFGDVAGFAHVVFVGFLGVAALALLLVPVALAERRLRRASHRGILVLTAVALAAGIRPFVNEAIYVGLYDAAPDLDGLGARIGSNVFVWLAGLSIIAMTVRSVELTRGSRRRLTDAIAALTAGRRRLARFESENRQMLAPLISSLRRRRDEMLGGTIDFAAVREYSEVVRAASHRLEERAALDLRAVEGDTGEHTVDTASRSPLTMLRPAPYLLTGFVFLTGAVPYAHHVNGPWAALAAILAGAPVTLAADALIRWLSRGRSPARRGRVLVAVWLVAGVAMTVVAWGILGPTDPTRFVPLISLPLVAIALAACTDAIARAADSAHRLETVLSLVARTLTAKTASARRPLRNAAHVLHGRVQGRCVLLAAAADEWELTPEDIETFRRETDAAFDSILAFIAEADSAALEGTLQSAHEDLFELVATWSSVLGVSSDISPEATDALQEPALSRRVATVVNEGFVNAIKHSEARKVWLSVDVADGTLIVRTWSIGVLDRVPVAGTDLRAKDVLGTGARIYQRDDAVVLEVPVPLSLDGAAAPTPAARRPWWAPRASRVG
ncbi:hypothetical protein ACIGEP_07755 [Microbacterium sp. NPDC077663]|uniref:hypothetical protein n=1 Tax=Microbacterium sp. NPDC077663 TaxID=3364189 RepID=UPI0037C6F595